MNEITSQVQSLELAAPRRSGRKRKMSQEAILIEHLPNEFKDGTAAPPSKKKQNFNSKAAIEKFYTCRTIGRIPRTDLETIYEESGIDGECVVGKKKIRRAINLDREYQKITKNKKIMRQKKIKRLGIGKKRLKKVTHEECKKILYQS